MITRWRTMLAIGLVLLFVGMVGWLASDQSPVSTTAGLLAPGGSDSAAPGQDSIGSAQEPSGLATGGQPQGGNLPSNHLGSGSLSSGTYDQAPADGGTESRSVGGSPRDGGPAPTSGPSVASHGLRPAPGGDAPPRFNGPGAEGTGSTVVPPPPGGHGGSPPPNGGSPGPRGGSPAPVVQSGSPGSSSDPGPDRRDGPGLPPSGPLASSDPASGAIPIPAPPSLVLFGVSALVAWLVSRR